MSDDRHRCARFIAVGVGAIALALWNSPAAAAQLILGSGGNWEETLHNDHQAPGVSLTLESSQSGYFVVYSSGNPGQVLTPNGNGFAKVEGPFASLTLDPQDPVIGFKTLGFKLVPPKSKYPPLNFDLLLNFAGGGTQLFTTSFASNNKFDILADDDEIISTVRFSNLRDSRGTTLNFSDVRQVSFDPELEAAAPVPEPATWALMIFGFGAVGASIRSARRKTALVAAA